MILTFTKGESHLLTHFAKNVALQNDIFIFRKKDQMAITAFAKLYESANTFPMKPTVLYIKQQCLKIYTVPFFIRSYKSWLKKCIAVITLNCYVNICAILYNPEVFYFLKLILLCNLVELPEMLHYTC